MADTKDTNVNSSLDSRREERATEQITEQYAHRINELTSANLEIWQKQMSLGAQIAHWWGDSFQTSQRALSQMVSAAQKNRVA